MAFKTPVDIANRALQLLRRPAINSFDDVSVEGRETKACYDQLRLDELRRNVWRFATRRAILRSITNTAQYLVAPTWVIGTSYQSGDIVNYANQYWTATTANSGQTPGTVPASGALYWESYFGPVVIDVWNAPIQPANSTSAGNLQPGAYFDGELVYKTPGDGTFTVYRSLISGNSFDPQQVDQWLDDTMYSTGQVVSYNGTNYQSRININFNTVPAGNPTQWTSTITSPLVSNSWRAVSSAQLTSLNINYPLGAGPASDTRTRNAYRLPAGFLRQAPSDPKADINPFLGAPSGLLATDWLFESNYIVSRNANPIMLRFCADVQSVPEFDSMFAAGLATRLAIELAPRLADADHFATIIADAREEYARTISDARAVNGIETGPLATFEDDYVSARL